jgi:hypothetical protein
LRVKEDKEEEEEEKNTKGQKNEEGKNLQRAKGTLGFATLSIFHSWQKIQSVRKM